MKKKNSIEMKITLFLTPKKNTYLIQSTLNFSVLEKYKNQPHKKTICHILGQYMMALSFSFSLYCLTNNNKKGRV